MDTMLMNSLQRQFNVERYNSQAYRALGYILSNLAWDGMAKFMFKSADEEQKHADRFADYLISRTITPVEESIPPIPDTTVDTGKALLSAALAALNLEVSTTSKINALYLEADEAQDPQTCVMLHWFIDEQTRSVREVYDMVQELQRADCSAALIALDEKYGEK